MSCGHDKGGPAEGLSLVCAECHEILKAQLAKVEAELTEERASSGSWQDTAQYLHLRLAKALKVVREAGEVRIMFGDDFSPSATWKGLIQSIKEFDGGGR